MPDLPIVEALYRARPKDPLTTWEVVQEVLGDDWAPVSAEELQHAFNELRDVDGLIKGELERGRPLEWKTILGVALVVLRRAINGEQLTVIDVHVAIDATVTAHFWRLDTFHYDRFAVRRSRHLDVFARLMLQVAKDDWLADLVHQPAGFVPPRTVGSLIDSRRQRDNLTMAQLAELADRVTESTVSRWIDNLSKPSAKHRAALKRVLGGEESDYA